MRLNGRRMSLQLPGLSDELRNAEKALLDFHLWISSLTTSRAQQLCTFFLSKTDSLRLALHRQAGVLTARKGLFLPHLLCRTRHRTFHLLIKSVEHFQRLVLKRLDYLMKRGGLSSLELAPGFWGKLKILLVLQAREQGRPSPFTAGLWRSPALGGPGPGADLS